MDSILYEKYLIMLQYLGIFLQMVGVLGTPNLILYLIIMFIIY